MLTEYITFKNILVFCKPEYDSRTTTVKEQIRKYARMRGIPFYVGEIITSDEPTLIVSIGGDGTMLAAMRASLSFPVATVVGFNTGTLGFLTEEIPASISEFLDGIWMHEDVEFEERMILKAILSVDGKERSNTYEAINEFILSGSTVNTPLTTQVYINDNFVSEQMGSGVLVATSTGSTAMALSSGGAIVSPSTNIMQIVPVLPHTLTARPIISTGRDSITLVGNLTDRVSGIEIHADGRVLTSVTNIEGTEVSITIEKHEKTVKIWHPKDWNFLSVLSEKMKW